MRALDPNQFPAYFRELHGVNPYPWQQRMAARACAGKWPGAIDLPTGSGKTACIDIAIFALACQAQLPAAERCAARRIFFCVNRRIIVDEAYVRARNIAEQVWKAERDQGDNKPVLRQVAQALRHVAGTSSAARVPPMDALELRGGIYRDNRWARSITQPTVVCTTIDQLGSRLLFRGYGVTHNAAPIQAALIAHDSLVLLDEAHICEPFRQTLASVRQFLESSNCAQADIGVSPMTVVPMTATPNKEMRALGVVNLHEDDRAHASLHRRLTASKPTQLRATHKLVDHAVEQACSLARGKPAAIGIVVNRISTAREIQKRLCDLKEKASGARRKLPEDSVIELVIGAMRPTDRDEQSKHLREIIGPNRPQQSASTSFVVSTQCIEVGADYDFDHLVTECASLDALRQRFGRLNRAGRLDEDGNPLITQARVLIDSKAVKSEADIRKKEASKEPTKRVLDPIYGNALARTWNWLVAHAEDDVIDFGIDAFQKLLDTATDDSPPPGQLLSPASRANAPVMLPAYLDLWCQTAPRPAADPDVSLFIHGPQRNEPDVQVCWRADLIDDGRTTKADWAGTIALLPPVSAECISVPISRLRRWLVTPSDKPREDVPGDDSDLLGVPAIEPAANPKTASQHAGVIWRGADRSVLVTSTKQLKPGDTLVLPATDTTPDSLGCLPIEGDVTGGPARIIDVAEVASESARDKAVLRLHPALYPTAPTQTFDDLLRAASRRANPPSRLEWSQLLDAAAKATADRGGAMRHRLETLASQASSDNIRIEVYPDERGVVLSSYRRLSSGTQWFIRAMDEGDDASSRIDNLSPVSLDDHSRHVRDMAAASLTQLPLDTLDKSTTLAAFLHDWGKADERFQAMLRRAHRTDTYLYAGAGVTPLAKSDGMPTTRTQRKLARQRSGLPEGFRHEMLSVQLAQQSGQLPDDPHQRELILHLVAAHHGYARPFAPVAPDDELPAVTFAGANLSHEQRCQQLPPHRLDSGIAQRFWTLTRRYGWWGLAYLEAVLRLADQQASAAEEAGHYQKDTERVSAQEVTA